MGGAVATERSSREGAAGGGHYNLLFPGSGAGIGKKGKSKQGS